MVVSIPCGVEKSKSQAGFSLIELSVVMVIIGILVAGALQAYTIYDEKSKIERMDIRMTRIDDVLKGFYDENGRLPCPAPVNSQAAGNNFDNEDCSIAPVNGVMIGKLPAEDLKLTNDFMRDIYGRYATYAVTRSLTDGSSTVGAITLRRKSTKVDVGLTEDTRLSEVDYVVLSAGKAGAGAFAFDGTVECPASGDERVNCDGNAVFMASDHSSGDAYYDDVVKYNNEVEFPAPQSLRRAERGKDYTHENRYAYNFEYEGSSGSGRDKDVFGDHYTMKGDSVMDVNIRGNPQHADVYETDNVLDIRKKVSLSDGDVVSVIPKWSGSKYPDSSPEIFINGEKFYSGTISENGTEHTGKFTGGKNNSEEYVYMNKHGVGPETPDHSARYKVTSGDNDPTTTGSDKSDPGAMSIYFWKN